MIPDYELNTVAICPEMGCQSTEIWQLDEQKCQCARCGAVFIHPVLVLPAVASAEEGEAQQQAA